MYITARFNSDRVSDRMDHFPPVSQPYNPIKVPYLKGPGFDGQEWMDYPERAGWKDVGSVKDFADGKYGSRTLDDAAKFLQDWLFFGILHVFFGPITISDFLTVDEIYLSTRKLPEYISTWKKNVQEDQAGAVYRLELECPRLQHVTNVLKVIAGPGATPFPGGFANELCITVLMSTLYSTQCTIYSEGHRLPLSVLPQTPNARAILADMIANGWCPKMMDHLKRKFSVQGL